MFEFEIDGFYFAFPLLMLFLGAQKRSPGGLQGMSASGLLEVGGQESLAVFTDKDLANRFLEQSGAEAKNVDVEQFDTPSEFLTLLDAVKDARIEAVVFDPDRAKEIARPPVAVDKLIGLLRSSQPIGD